jgi:hypothetical protein
LWERYNRGNFDPNEIAYPQLDFNNLEMEYIKSVESFLNLPLYHYTYNRHKEVADAVENIGNITLFTSTPPTNWHTLSFAEKKCALKGSVAEDLILTEQVCEYNDWDTNSINNRTGKLFNSFKLMWPRPEI